MINTIKSRRSCRRYTEEKVREQELQEIVECALLAPSGMNMQGISLCVITNERILNELENLMGRAFFYHAPALIVVYCRKDYKYAIEDGSCALSQMYLAAHSLGLGSCWINQLKDVKDDPKFQDIFEQLNLNQVRIVGALAVGHIFEKAKERIIQENRVHYIK